MTELSKFTKVLSNFEIDKLISIGKGESVYKISTKLLRAPFELSLYSDYNDELKSKLNNFSKVAKLIQHRNITRFFEVHESSNSCCFVYEHVEGLSLEESFKGKTITKRLAMDIFVQILSAIKYLHDHEIYHLSLSLKRFRIDDDGDVKLVISFCSHREYEAHYKAPETKNKQIYYENIWALGIIFRMLLHAADPYQFSITKEFFEGDFKLPRHLKEYEPLLKSMLHEDKRAKTKAVDLMQNSLIKNAINNRYEDDLNCHKFSNNENKKCLEIKNKSNPLSFDEMFEEKCRKQLLEQKPFYKSKSHKANATSLKKHPEDKFILRIPYQLKRTEEFVHRILLEREIVHTVGNNENIWVCYHFDPKTEIVTSFKIVFQEVRKSLYCNINFVFLKGTDDVYDRFIEAIYTKVDFFN